MDEESESNTDIMDTYNELIIDFAMNYTVPEGRSAPSSPEFIPKTDSEVNSFTDLVTEEGTGSHLAAHMRMWHMQESAFLWRIKY